MEIIRANKWQGSTQVMMGIDPRTTEVKKKGGGTFTSMPTTLVCSKCFTRTVNDIMLSCCTGWREKNGQIRLRTRVSLAFRLPKMHVSENQPVHIRIARYSVAIIVITTGNNTKLPRCHSWVLKQLPCYKLCCYQPLSAKLVLLYINKQKAIILLKANASSIFAIL